MRPPTPLPPPHPLPTCLGSLPNFRVRGSGLGFPCKVVLGRARMLAAWEEGIPTMRPGEVCVVSQQEGVQVAHWWSDSWHPLPAAESETRVPLSRPRVPTEGPPLRPNR